jgi:hypothetical protein
VKREVLPLLDGPCHTTERARTELRVRRRLAEANLIRCTQL